MRFFEQSVARKTLFGLAATVLATAPAFADPVVTRLNPPSRVFDATRPGSITNPNGPIIARFFSGQRFDLQATVQLDAGTTVTNWLFTVDGNPIPVGAGPNQIRPNATALTDIGSNRVSLTARAYSNTVPGVHTFMVTGTQSDGKTFSATGNFEVVGPVVQGRRAKNVIVFIGDGMGIAHRTAARLMLRNVSMGKADGLLSMDTFPFTGLVMTHSLNSIVTDSSPGAACYSNGNKSNNNQHGVFPDDTADNFDNPRVELMGEYMYRTQGKALGIVTTSDIFDATPAAFGSHTQSRGAGTGIIDQYLNEQTDRANLRVLLGGGRRWFLPGPGVGSSRAASTDYVLPADVAAGWLVPQGSINPGDDVIAQFQGKGFTYTPNKAALDAIPGNTTRLLGLFHTGNMNVALDKIAKRRNAQVGNLGGKNPTSNGFVVDEYGYPDQPMLDEMTDKALQVLNRNSRGFTLMVEAASIDKQAHNMDTERWILDTIEFDRAIQVAKTFAMNNPDTLIVITADHECAGVNIIGSSVLTNAQLVDRSDNGDGVASLRNGVVGTYEAAGFPRYTIAGDGYPTTTDPDRKFLIGYAANADRYEDWLTNPLPLRDGQSILNPPAGPGYGSAPLNAYPASPLNRDTAGNFLVTGQIADGVAAHTASDIPLSAFGRGAYFFTGVMDNTDVFFRIMQALVGGAN